MVCQCKQCGKSFVLTDGEIEFYKSKGLNLPKRCKECRKKNNGNNNPVSNSVKPNRSLSDKKTDDSAFSYSSRKNNAKAVFKPTGSGGIGVKTVVISACLIIVALIALFAGKIFNSGDNYEPTYYINTAVYVEQTENEPETETETVETTAYTQPETTSTTVYTQYYYTQAQNTYRFRNYKLLASHYEKHGKEMGFSSKEAYEAAASAVITNPRAVSKIESDDNDGDTVYFIKQTGEIVFLSYDGYIRTYFIATEDYYNRQ